MAYVISQPCIGAKEGSCVEVCPVDCIHPAPGEPGHETAEQLFIDPSECIDCDACLTACPVEAIAPQSLVPPQWTAWIDRNADYFRERPA